MTTMPQPCKDRRSLAMFTAAAVPMVCTIFGMWVFPVGNGMASPAATITLFCYGPIVAAAAATFAYLGYTHGAVRESWVTAGAEATVASVVLLLSTVAVVWGLSGAGYGHGVAALALFMTGVTMLTATMVYRVGNTAAYRCVYELHN